VSVQEQATLNTSRLSSGSRETQQRLMMMVVVVVVVLVSLDLLSGAAVLGLSRVVNTAT